MSPRIQAESRAVGVALLVAFAGSVLPVWKTWGSGLKPDPDSAGSLWSAARDFSADRRVDSTRDLLALHRRNLVLTAALAGIATAAGIAAYRVGRQIVPTPPADPDPALDRLTAVKRRGILLDRGRARPRRPAPSVPAAGAAYGEVGGDPLDRLMQVKHRLGPADPGVAPGPPGQ